MKDTIYREAAIDALAENMPSTYTPDGSHPADDGIFIAQEVYADCIQMLKELPSAQPEQRWIPCSERLPESIKPVIITWRNNDPKSYYQYIVGKPFIGTGHYCKGKWFWYSSTCEDLLAEYGRSDVDEVDEAIEVIAWQELPEPYRGE